jgi:putative flippase GtrA
MAGFEVIIYGRFWVIAEGLLVQNARLPLLMANSIAILCCSVVNFCLGDCWAFAAQERAECQI